MPLTTEDTKFYPRCSRSLYL